MTLIHFLILWSHFSSTHICQVWQPDSTGLGQHVIYGGNCSDGFHIAQSLHTTVTWTGTPPDLSQGILNFR